MDPSIILKEVLKSWGITFRSSFNIGVFPPVRIQILLDLVTAVENSCVPCAHPQTPEGAMAFFARVETRPGVMCEHATHDMHICDSCFNIQSCELSSVGRVAVFARVSGEIFDGYQELSVAFMASMILNKGLVVYLPDTCAVSPLCAKIIEKSQCVLKTFNMDMIARECIKVLDDDPPPVDVSFDENWVNGLYRACKVIEGGSLPSDWNDPFWKWIQIQRHRYLLDHSDPLSDLMIVALNQAFPSWRHARLDTSRRLGFSISSVIDFVGVHRRFPRQGEPAWNVALKLRDSGYKGTTQRILDFFIPGWRCLT